MAEVWYFDDARRLCAIGADNQRRVVWSVASNPASWEDDGGSMPVERFLRHGYRGGRLGKRMRRVRREMYDAAVNASAP